MSSKIPPDALDYYISLGMDRSYQLVAEHYSVSKRAVTKRAARDRWQQKVIELDRRARDASEKKTVESLSARTEAPVDDDTEQLSLAEIRREYLRDLKHRVTPAHHRNVEPRLRRTLEALAVKAYSELRPLALIRYRNELREQGASPRTANLVVDSLRAMLRWAVECGLIEENPIGRVPRLPDGAGHQRCVRRALTDEEIERFLAAAEDDDRDTAHRWRTRGGGEKNLRRTRPRVPQAVLWRAFLETGARWSELTRVAWADINLEARSLMLRAEHTKARRRRVVPLGDRLVRRLCGLRELLLEALPQVGESDPVFWTPEGARWSQSTNNAMRIFNRILKRAGIPRSDGEGRKVDIHALRHYADSGIMPIPAFCGPRGGPSLAVRASL